MEVPVGHEAGSERAERVGALHAQHRARVGVAEVVQPVVVADRVAADVRAGLVGRDVAAALADHDADLALVVQVAAPRWAHDLARRARSATRSACGSRSAPARASPGTPRGGSRSSGARRRSSSGSTGGRWTGSSSGIRRPSGATSSSPSRTTAVGTPSSRMRRVSTGGPLPCGRSWPKRTIGAVSGAARVHAAAHAGGPRVDRAEPAVALLGRRAHDRVPHRPGQRRGAAAAGCRAGRRGPGAVAIIWADWQSCSDRGEELLDPVRSQYKEAFVVVRCTLRAARPTRGASTSGSTRTSRSRAAGTRATRRSSARSG